MVFEIKMDFTCKEQFIDGGHTTEAPALVMYRSVVSHDSVHLAILLAALNDIDILYCNLENAYLNAKFHEKIWFKGGIKCGEDAGKVMIVVRAIYRLKSAGALWHVELAQLLADLCYQSMKADPDIWIQKVVCSDGFEYYEMLFVYVNDILAVSHHTQEVIAEITRYYKAKDGSIKEHSIYLGDDIAKFQMPDGQVCWSISPRTYVKNAIEVVECLLVEDNEGYALKSKVKNPFPSGYYRSELDVTNELGPELAT